MTIKICLFNAFTVLSLLSDLHFIGFVTIFAKTGNLINHFKISTMKKIFISCLTALAALTAGAAPQAEYLNRGVVAVATDQGVFVSWRSLITDDPSMTFDIYRNGVKVNDTPISKVTNFTDAAGTAGAVYEVKAIVGSSTVDSNSSKAWDTPYKKVHLQRPAGGSVGANNESPHSYTYTPDDISIGDVDGDGEFELFVKWMPSDAKDSASTGFTGPTLIDCYKQDGTFLWRIDLGHNIRSGNHYTQFMVYDFDGDGCAELICKTAPGTKDGKGKWVLMPGDKETDDYRMHVNEPSKIFGHVRGGAEYLTCFSGKTGEELSTIAYKPGYNYVSESIWGDNYCNRSDRYLGGVAYLDGQHPSVIMARGYYRCAFVWAVDFKDGQLKEVWFHESKDKDKGLWGEGAHALSVGDVDFDGKDEIIYGAGALDHDGKLLYRTNPGGNEGHGDALHLAKMLPDRPGLQVFMPHEETESSYPFDTEMRDARTGEIIFYKPQSGKDVGRGIAANVSANYPGYEYWAASDANVYSYGKAIAANRPPINFRIYWDGDLLDELLDGVQISKPAPDFSKIGILADFSQYSNAAACNGTKNTPNLSCDLFGDWREEVILHDGSTQSDLLIFTTTIPTNHKIPCLLQDRQYREAIAWQNTAYNQPPHLSYCPEDEYDEGATIMLMSGTANQAVTIDQPIEPIVLLARNCESLVLNGQLPAGLNWNYDAADKKGTLSGAPSEEGEYSISIATVGAPNDENVYFTIKLIVKRNNTLTLVSYYSFDDPGETLANHVSGKSPATIVGTVPGKIDGKKGGAALFDGTQHYVQSTYDEIQMGMKDFTIEFWMNSTDDAAYILHKGSHTANDATGTSGKWIGLELKNNNLTFAIDDDITKTECSVKTVGDTYFNGEWHHVVLVRDAFKKQLLFYIDGKECASATDKTGDISDNNEDFVIGNVNVNFDNSYVGALDELCIYHGVMSPEKVAERYLTTGRDLAYFPFDEVGETTPNLVFGNAVAESGIPTAVEGLKGGAVSFENGAYYKQEAYDAIQMGENSFSIELWINSTDADGYILFKGSHAENAAMGTTGHWIGLERKNNYLDFVVDDNINKTDCQLADANYAFDGKWHHIVCVRDYPAQELILYIDGKEVKRATGVKTGALADNNEPLLIGISDETARPYEGLIDELVIRPVVMTPDEVLASYLALAESGIENVVNDANALYTVVDIYTGAIIRQAYGVNRIDIMDNVAPGAYALVIDKNGKREVFKFIRR